MRRPLLAAACLLALAACKKPGPPPAAAAEPIPVDGTHRKIDTDDYLEYRIATSIEAPRDVVWEVLKDEDSYLDWNTTMTHFEGEVEQGGSVELKVKVAGKRTFKLDVSTLSDDTMVWEDGNNMFRGVRTFKLTAVDEDTTEFSMAEAMTGSMLKMIKKKLPDFGPDYEAWASGLKAEAESRYTPPEPEPVLEPDPVPPADSDLPEDAAPAE